jgi:hypothetical protein
LLAELKPRFIHHPKSKELIRSLLASFGCDLDRTYFDVPRMLTSTSDDYLTSGISYAFHPHRDTWYSAPFSQLNWWIPIYPMVPENVMATPRLQFSCNHVRVTDAPESSGPRSTWAPHAEAAMELLKDSPAVLVGSAAECAQRLLEWRDRFGISYWHLGPDVDAVSLILDRLGLQA